MNYVNIDAIMSNKKKKGTKFSLKKAAIITILSAGIIGSAAKIKDNKEKAEEHARKVAEIESTTEKMYSVYTVKQGDTLTSIANKYMDATPELKILYNPNEYIDMIAKTSGLSSNNVLIVGQTLWIPNLVTKEIAKEKSDFYNEKQEAANKLPDYEDYYVKMGDSFWSIAKLYSDNEQEQAALANKIQNLNNNIQLLQVNSTIKIPNIEKYKLLHETYNVEQENVPLSR